MNDGRVDRRVFEQLELLQKRFQTFEMKSQSSKNGDGSLLLTPHTTTSNIARATARAQSKSWALVFARAPLPIGQEAVSLLYSLPPMLFDCLFSSR